MPLRFLISPAGPCLIDLLLDYSSYDIIIQEIPLVSLEEQICVLKGELETLESCSSGFMMVVDKKCMKIVERQKQFATSLN